MAANGHGLGPHLALHTKHGHSCLSCAYFSTEEAACPNTLRSQWGLTISQELRGNRQEWARKRPCYQSSLPFPVTTLGSSGPPFLNESVLRAAVLSCIGGMRSHMCQLFCEQHLSHQFCKKNKNKKTSFGFLLRGYFTTRDKKEIFTYISSK